MYCPGPPQPESREQGGDTSAAPSQTLEGFPGTATRAITQEEKSLKHDPPKWPGTNESDQAGPLTRAINHLNPTEYPAEAEGESLGCTAQALPSPNAGWGQGTIPAPNPHTTHRKEPRGLPRRRSTRVKVPPRHSTTEVDRRTLENAQDTGKVRADSDFEVRHGCIRRCP